jgi:signal peptidase I
VGVPSAAPVQRARRAPLARELLLLVALAALLTAVVKDFAVEAFRIPAGSMEDTLQPGDRVLVNRLVYHVRGFDRGDVVVFSGAGSWDSPRPAQPGGLIDDAYHRTLELLGMESTGTDYVKRVIGLPGDRCPAVRQQAGSPSTACRWMSGPTCIPGISRRRSGSA